MVVYGEGKRYLTAGIWLNEDAVRAHLTGQDIGPEGAAAAVPELVQRSVDRVNGELASYETIKKFAVIATPLTVADGLLTATLKVRRKKVYEHFRDVFEALYWTPPASAALTSPPPTRQEPERPVGRRKELERAAQ